MKFCIFFFMVVYIWEDELLEVLLGLENLKYEFILVVKFYINIISKYYGDDYVIEVK